MHLIVLFVHNSSISAPNPDPPNSGTKLGIPSSEAAYVVAVPVYAFDLLIIFNPNTSANSLISPCIFPPTSGVIIRSRTELLSPLWKSRM